MQGLSIKQASILNILISCVNAEEMAMFISNLPKSDQEVADSILLLLHLESMEDKWKLEEKEEFPEASIHLKKFDKAGERRMIEKWMDDQMELPYPTDEEIIKAFDENRDPFEDPIYLKRLNDYYEKNPEKKRNSI